MMLLHLVIGDQHAVRLDADLGRAGAIHIRARSHDRAMAFCPHLAMNANSMFQEEKNQSLGAAVDDFPFCAIELRPVSPGYTQTYPHDRLVLAVVN